MKNSIKNLYLPGTNKNVGYLDKDTMHIYKQFIKYLPLPVLDYGTYVGASTFTGPIIFTQKEKKVEKNIQLSTVGGYIYNIDTKTNDFYNCKFKAPDNLDVIEMAYLYKHWKVND